MAVHFIGNFSPIPARNWTKMDQNGSHWTKVCQIEPDVCPAANWIKMDQIKENGSNGIKMDQLALTWIKWIQMDNSGHKCITWESSKQRWQEPLAQVIFLQLKMDWHWSKYYSWLVSQRFIYNMLVACWLTLDIYSQVSSYAEGWWCSYVCVIMLDAFM